MNQLLVLRNNLGDSGLGEAEKWGRKRQKTLSHPLFGVAAGRSQAVQPHSFARISVPQSSAAAETASPPWFPSEC